MKKMSQILAVAMLLCTISLYGQGIQPTELEGTVSIPTYQTMSALPLAQMNFNKMSRTMAGPMGLYNFDQGIPPLFWNIPTQYTFGTTPVIMESMAQRFTQQTGAGTLDSAWVYLWRLPLGNARFDVMKDTMLTGTSGKTYHWPNYMSASGLIDSSEVTFLQVDSSRWTTVLFNGMIVPKEFHLAVRPMTVSGITSAFTILTDSRVGQTADFSTDAARTSFLAVVNGTQVTQISLYGLFTWHPTDGLDTARNPQVYMVAWITPDMAADANPIKDPTGMTLYQNYPNPVSSAHSRTNVRFEVTQAGVTTLEVYDAVGRLVETATTEFLSPGVYTRVLNVGKLAAGCYSYRLTNSGKVLSHTFVVLR
jgi:hypothetical protein